MPNFKIGYQPYSLEPHSTEFEAESLSSAVAQVEKINMFAIGCNLVSSFDLNDQLGAEMNPLRCKVVYVHELPEPAPKLVFTVYYKRSDGTYGHSVVRSAESKEAAASMVDEELAMCEPLTVEILSVVEKTREVPT